MVALCWQVLPWQGKRSDECTYIIQRQIRWSCCSIVVCKMWIYFFLDVKTKIGYIIHLIALLYWSHTALINNSGCFPIGMAFPQSFLGSQSSNFICWHKHQLRTELKRKKIFFLSFWKSVALAPINIQWREKNVHTPL